MTDTTEIARIAAGLSDAQRRMVMASEPDDLTGLEGIGVDLRGSAYRTARALDGMGLGSYTHGSFIADMYWSKPLGLAVRAHLKAQSSSNP